MIIPAHLAKKSREIRAYSHERQGRACPAVNAWIPPWYTHLCCDHGSYSLLESRFKSQPMPTTGRHAGCPESTVHTSYTASPVSVFRLRSGRLFVGNYGSVVDN